MSSLKIALLAQSAAHNARSHLARSTAAMTIRHYNASVVKDTPTPKKSKFADKFANGPSFDDFVGGNEKLSVEEALELKETVVDKEAAAATATTGKPGKRAPKQRLPEWLKTAIPAERTTRRSRRTSENSIFTRSAKRLNAPTSRTAGAVESTTLLQPPSCLWETNARAGADSAQSRQARPPSP